LQSAHPKIQKMCEEESDDPEAVHKLLEINDSIHRTIERYKLVKKGDLHAASQIPKGTLGTTTGVSKNANNELSLIDFDPEPEPSSNGNEAGPSQGGNSLENDLLGLSLGEQSPSPGGGISLGSSSKYGDTIFQGTIADQYPSEFPIHVSKPNAACPVTTSAAGANSLQT
jgi:ADP-ribosylation factor-binding protein GGA